MTIDVIIEDSRWGDLGLVTLAEDASARTLRAVNLDPDDFEISLMACDDIRIAALNADFRQKNQPTNVLSWPSDERAAETDGGTPIPPELPQEAELGDIAIAYDTCAHEAIQAGKPLTDHVTHLIVHGTLHLLGYDHERDADATLMEGIESQVLVNMGLSDPYV